MSKLKRLTEEDHVQRFYDDPYHCCRWCHWSAVEDPFEGRKCFYHHNSTVEAESGIFDVYSVAEDGHLAQAIEEVLNTQRLSDKFMYRLMGCFEDWKLSNNRRAEFMEHFREEWSEFVDFDLKEELDEKISTLYQKKIEEGSKTEGFCVSDDFCCKYFE